MAAGAAAAPLDDAVIVGAGLRLRPAYDGASSRRVDVIPVLRYYGQPWFARTTQGMLEGGARTTLTPGIALGAQIAWEAGRVRDESAFLRDHQLENIGPGLSAGAHLEWDSKLGPSPVSTLLRWRTHTRSALGSQADLRITAGIHGGERLNAGVFAQATWADARSAQAYYGLTPAQSASSALPAHRMQAGVLYTAFGLLWSWDLNRAWLLTGGVESRRLAPAARRSPLTGDAANEYLSVAIARRY